MTLCKAESRAEEIGGDQRGGEEKGGNTGLETPLTSGSVLKWLLEWTLSLEDVVGETLRPFQQFMELNQTLMYTLVHYLRQSICLKTQRERGRETICIGKTQQRNVKPL